MGELKIGKIYYCLEEKKNQTPTGSTLFVNLRDQ